MTRYKPIMLKPKGPVKSQAELIKAFQKLPAKFAECRERSFHLWTKERVFNSDRPEYAYLRIRVCPCGTRRTEYISSRGMVELKTYDHPEGYRLQGYGMITAEDKGALRLQVIGRLLEREAQRGA